MRLQSDSLYLFAIGFTVALLVSIYRFYGV